MIIAVTLKRTYEKRIHGWKTEGELGESSPGNDQSFKADIWLVWRRRWDGDGRMTAPSSPPLASRTGSAAKTANTLSHLLPSSPR